MPRSVVVVLCAAAFLLLGCSGTRAYSGPELGESQLAVIVPDNPRVRAWDNPLSDAGGHGGQVYLQVNGQRLAARSNRFEVAPGRINMVAIFRDHQTPVTARMLQTKPVTLAFDAQAGRTYRVHGVAFYPPAASPLRRTADTTKYRVVFAVQDADSGQLLQQVNVPTDRIELVDSETGDVPW